jgi:ectoine hydroxylase-related dioxygenase (phytanoyl-CoA dioxygenase family)
MTSSTAVLSTTVYVTQGFAYKKGGGFYDPTGRLSHRDLPCSQLIVDFNTTAWGPLDGAIRFVPGTQNSRLPIPSLSEEPQWMKMSTVCPIPAGCAVLRDIRCWHGGTPCVGSTPR